MMSGSSLQRVWFNCSGVDAQTWGIFFKAPQMILICIVLKTTWEIPSLYPHLEPSPYFFFLPTFEKCHVSSNTISIVYLGHH